MSEYDDAFSGAFGGKKSSEYDDIFSNSLPSSKAKKTDQVSEPVSDFSGTLRFGPLDTGLQLPEGVNKRLAQFGSGTADLLLGAKQRLGYATEDDAAFKRKADAQLNSDFTGKALSFAGKAMPGFALPGFASAPVLSGAGIGALYGALEPTVKGESTAFNTAAGGVLGAAIPAAVSGYRYMSSPADGLASKAINEYGIPLNVGDISNGKVIKAARSVLNDLPITGSIGASQQAAKQEAFNAAVGRTFGADAKALTPEVMDSAKGKITGELNRIWDNNNLSLDGTFIQKLQDIGKRSTNLNPEQQKMVETQIQNLLSKVDVNGQIPGKFVNNWQSELRLSVDGEKGLAKDILANLRREGIGAFNRSVSGSDASALGTARTQYGAFKTIEPLMNKAEAGVAGRVSGDVPAALLPQQVVSQYGNNLKNSPFSDLSGIAGRFIVDRTPQTGGSLRALMQNSILANGIGLAASPLGIATQSLTGPKMARQMVSQPVVRGLLDNPEMLPTLRELSRNGMQRMPIAIGGGLLSLPALE